MGHRHMLNSLPKPDETDDDPGLDYSKPPYKPICGMYLITAIDYQSDGPELKRHRSHVLSLDHLYARTGAFGSSSLVHPVENMSIQNGPFPSSVPSSSAYSSFIIHNSELMHHQPTTPGQSSDPFPHRPADRNYHTLPSLHHPSSSRLGGQTYPRVDEDSHNRTVSRVCHKRKSPSVSQLPGPTSRYDVGSSSNLQLPADTHHKKMSTDMTYHTHRNVRSRAGVELEHDLVGAHLSSSSLQQQQQQPFSSRSSDRTDSVDYSRWNLNTLVTESNRGLTIGSGIGFFNHDPNAMNALNVHSNGSAQSGGNRNYAASNRTTVPQNANAQSIRAIQSGYDRRSSTPTSMASSSNFLARQIAASNEGLQLAAENYSSMNQRVVSAIRLLYSQSNNGGAGISSQRFRSSTEQALIAAVRRSAHNGSRNPFDRHTDMRLDVDNMSYEELLALGERIGSVSTGLSENLISKCLTESVYCWSDQFEDDERCIICLEEYKHMDDVGNLKCGHDFHVGCIRKWLSMKNLCPICKLSTMDDETNKMK